MTTAREIMHAGAICGDDDVLHGMITDRDIVIKCLATGMDATTTTAGELAQGSAYHVSGEATIQEMLNVMEEHQVRRLPVIENHRLVGIVSEADIARNLSEHEIAQFVKAICSPKALTSH
jgi:CBS domain-containing protein